MSSSDQIQTLLTRYSSDRPTAIVLGPDDHFRARDVPAADVVLADREIFPDGEQLIRLRSPERLRDADVLVVHSTNDNQDRALTSVLQLVDLIGTSCGPRSVSCFTPYLCYQRQDRAMRPGEAVTARVVIQAIAAAGAQLLITVDRHGLQPSGPGLPRMIDLTCADRHLAGPEVSSWRPDAIVAPDHGAARRMAAVNRHGLPIVVLDKLKDASLGTHYAEIPDELRGSRCLVIEDLCSTGSTLVPLQAALAKAGAEVGVFVTHLLAGPQVIRARLREAHHVAFSDSCGHLDAAVRVLPLAMAAWQNAVVDAVQGHPADRADHRPLSR